MSLYFDKVLPEEVGIDTAYLKNFVNRLKLEDIPMHSVLLMRHGKLCYESYYAPYTKDTLHRMFSITKSMVSLAIGLLAEEGKLSLDDHIVDYFPEKLPKEGAHPYLKMLTIRQMLTMRTCHDQNTYKASGTVDWVGSFFTTTPNHVPGTNFSYDTASTHTLGALVEKLSGMELLEYLRVKFLDEIGFSKEAFILKDPCGVSMGGSGMCALPTDILKVIYLISKNGKLGDKQLLPVDYLLEATTKQSDPYAKHHTFEEMQGYGYQIWMTRNGGYSLYGMGGQFAMYFPDKDIILVTTADTQGRQGGVQLIYDAFWQEIYNKIDDSKGFDLSDDLKASKKTELEAFETSQSIITMNGSFTSPMANKINNTDYVFEANNCAVTNLKISISEDGGVLYYTNATGNHNITFGFGNNITQQFPDYNLKCVASAAWRTDNNLLIKVQLIDSSVGNLFISLSFIDNYITVMFAKVEESLLNEYNGVFSGVAR